MKLLIKNATIIDAKSPYHLQQKDLLIESGKIAQISDFIVNENKVKEVASENLHVSAGWMDIGTQLGEPGLEHRETFETAIAAARTGGFTALAPFPNTIPVLQNKAALSVLQELSRSSAIHIYPVAALTKDCSGSEISEMYDLHLAGAKAFSDGLKSIQHNGVLLNALNYVKAFDGLIIHFPQDAYLSKDGQMHEGYTSTLLGMKGIPEMAETITLHRDLSLQEYAGSRLCIYGISSAKSLNIAKNFEKAEVTYVVPYLNLVFDDSELGDFNSNLKVTPPLRTNSDKNRLVRALNADAIHAICSNHYPLDEEAKNLEFPYAKFGASGLETVFSALNSALGDKIKTEKLIEKLTVGPRTILQIPNPVIEEGQLAELTLFDPSASWTFSKTKSLSKNNPFLGKTFKGKVVATVVDGKVFMNF